MDSIRDRDDTVPARPGIRRATARDADTVSDVLARAFETNPFMRWLLPDDRHYAEVAAPFFRIGVERELAEGEVYTTGTVEGAALWLPPGSATPGVMTQLKLGVRIFQTIGTRTMVAAKALTRFESERPPTPHWYLTVLGTDPERQGRGVGGALIAPVLERCDATGVAAYLESSNPDNVRYYERFGFEVTDEIRFADGPVVPLMLRKPH